MGWCTVGVVGWEMADLGTGIAGSFVKGVEVSVVKTAGRWSVMGALDGGRY